jgi:hypothetical protein
MVSHRLYHAIIHCVPGHVITRYQLVAFVLQGYRPISQVKGADGKTESVAGAFEWFTYETINTRITNIASGLVHLNLAPANDLGVRCNCCVTF